MGSAGLIGGSNNDEADLRGRPRDDTGDVELLTGACSDDEADLRGRPRDDTADVALLTGVGSAGLLGGSNKECLLVTYSSQLD